MAPVQKKQDDFVILNLSNPAVTGGRVENYVLTGPAIDGWSLRFDSMSEAEAKGRDLAMKAGVSLWYEPEPNKNAGDLIHSYRHSY